METFLRFAHINPVSLSVAITLALVFGYLGHQARYSQVQYYRVLVLALLTGSSMSLVGKYQGWW